VQPRVICEEALDVTTLVDRQVVEDDVDLTLAAHTREEALEEGCAELAVAPGRAACRRRVRAPGAGARTGKTASASGVTTGATVWITRLSVSSRL
jgi:hypothetical protein